MGFALENYDAVGRWRDEDAGKPVDNAGEMPDGTKFAGPDELKAVLLEHKDLFIRNLTSKMLGYALGRGLTLKDSCTVDNIVAQLKDNNYSAQTLIEAIVLSVPFRYQAGGAQERSEGAAQAMTSSKISISRRALLRGAGVGLGLPWLEAMIPASAMASSKMLKDPVRLAVLYMPNGVNTDAWSPQGTGRDFTLSPTLAPLADLKDQVVVLSNLWNANSKGGDGHYVKEAAILTCATIKKTPGADLANGVSMDQVAAQRVADQTPLPSLELGVTPVAIGVDAAVGYTRVYGSHIAWSSPTTPLARETESALGV